MRKNNVAKKYIARYTEININNIYIYIHVYIKRERVFGSFVMLIKNPIN